jgi:Na+-translocating ferredoxin:NAD+ oxidoreductase RnfC subunit
MSAPEILACGVRAPGISTTHDGLPRLLPLSLDGQPTSLARHLARHGNLRIPRAMMAEIDKAGLTGRGGAAFPTARKLAAVAAAAGRPVVVVNGTEGEPASAKDKVLLATEPHLVLDGAVIAARLAGACEVIVAAHRAVADTIDDAIGARYDDVDIRVVEAADARRAPS